MDLRNGSGNPLPFLKCANGTLLPLTLRGPSATMPLGKIFTTVCEGRNRFMAGRVVMPPITEEGERAAPPLGVVSGVVDTMGEALFVSRTRVRVPLARTP